MHHDFRVSLKTSFPTRAKMFSLCKEEVRYLALLREQKEQLVKEYGEKLARAQVVIWSKYQGLTVEEAMTLRQQLRAVGAEALVVKNTLMRIALEQAERSMGKELLSGPCLVTFVYEEIAPAAKAVANFARANSDKLTVAGGLIGDELVDTSQISALANLPPRDVLLGQVVGTIQAPISGLVRTLAAVMRGVLNVLNARAEQLEGAAN